MSLPLVANDVLRVVYACYVNEPKQLGESRLHYRVVNAGGFNLEDVAPFLRARLVVPYKGWLPTTAFFAGVSVQRILPAPRSGVLYEVGENFGLASAAGFLPTQASGLISYKTSGIAAVIAGDPPVIVSPALPGTHGRSYIPFPAGSHYDPATNQFTAGAQTKLGAIRTKLGPIIDLGGGASLQQIILRGTKTFDVISSAPSPNVATQRRRGAFGALNRPFGG